MSKEDATSPLTRSTFSGRRPGGAGDLSVEMHGIAPVPSDQRYGTPRRLFTVWFAPQVNMAGVFSGTLPIVLGLGFWRGLLAMGIGTVLGAVIVAYLSTWGPRTGAGQLANSRMAFRGVSSYPPSCSGFHRLLGPHSRGSSARRLWRCCSARRSGSRC